MFRQNLIQNLTAAFKEMLRLHSDFKEWMQQAGVNMSPQQFDKLAKYVQLLRKKNEELNLTAIKDTREIWIKHILDSLIAIPFLKIKPGGKVIDIGTGGGLPGIPLAILFPSVQFTLIDSTQKKIAAVEEFAKELNLKNVICHPVRAEVVGQHAGHRDRYDAVLARAVAPLKVLIELCVPLVRLYGSVIAYKGPEYLSELSDARNAITKLRAEPPQVFHYTLPEKMGQRTIIRITKKQVTPDIYPRKDGMPGKRPL